LLIQISILNF